MVRQSVRIALLVGTVAAVAAAAPARADQQAAPGCCCPATRTICVTECVPETYQVKRITYTTEQRVEKYTCCKCEQYQEVRERTVCCNKYVTEWQDQVRRVCVRVPCCEERTVMKPCYSYVTETKMVSKCVDRGHWECREEYSHWKAFCNHLGSLCSSDCCCSCPPSNCVSRRVWCPCMVQECCPVTCCRRVCEMRPEVCRVQTCKIEVREEKCKVCVTRCCPESHVEKYTVCLSKMVPYEATRTVCCSVPHEEMVTCTRMVARCVTREVPCCNDPCNTCCNSCNTCNTCNSCNSCDSCCNTCGHGCGLFSGCSLFRGCGLFGGCGNSCNSCNSCNTCNSCGSCNTGCSTGCGGCGGCGGLFGGCGGFGGLFGGCGHSSGCCSTGCCN
jgi:hypothetical protein